MSAVSATAAHMHIEYSFFKKNSTVPYRCCALIDYPKIKCDLEGVRDALRVL